MQAVNTIGIQLTSRREKPSLLLWLEWTILFVALPFALRFLWKPSVAFGVMFVAAVGTAIWLLRRRNFDRRLFWQGLNVRGEWKQLKRILLRFAVCSALIAGLVLFLYPQNFFDMPRERPHIWAVIMIFYPLLSVYPQELIYRTFFFERYRPLFPSSLVTVLASAAAFALVHIIFQNPLAVLLTLIGGAFFAETYARTRSLRLVWLEHALYGCLIFTVGLGQFFYHARVPGQ